MDIDNEGEKCVMDDADFVFGSCVYGDALDQYKKHRKNNLRGRVMGFIFQLLNLRCLSGIQEKMTCDLLHQYFWNKENRSSLEIHRFGAIAKKKKISKDYLKRNIKKEGCLVYQRILSADILDAQ